MAEKTHLISPSMNVLLITGFCGGFTTFSSFADDMYLLLQQKHWLFFALYVGLSFLLGLALVLGPAARWSGRRSPRGRTHGKTPVHRPMHRGFPFGNRTAQTVARSGAAGHRKASEPIADADVLGTGSSQRPQRTHAPASFARIGDAAVLLAAVAGRQAGPDRNPLRAHRLAIAALRALHGLRLQHQVGRTLHEGRTPHGRRVRSAP